MIKDYHHGWPPGARNLKIVSLNCFQMAIYDAAGRVSFAVNLFANPAIRGVHVRRHAAAANCKLTRIIDIKL